MTKDIDRIPKISIIIPAYNVSQYIKRCVESAINQTLKDIEIIIINDGSSDNTLETIKNIKSQDKRIILISQKNQGVSEARNAGIDIAKGEYIQYLDGDDWIESNACEETYNYARQNDLDMVVFDYYEDDDGKLKYIKDFDVRKDDIISGEEYVKLFFCNKSCPAIWSKLWKRNLYDKIRHPKGINFGEDLATTPRLAFKAKKIGKINEAFVHYILNPNSITRDKGMLKIYQLEEVFKILECYFKDCKNILFILDSYKLSHMLDIPRSKPAWNNEKYIRGVEMLLRVLRDADWKNLKYPLNKKIFFKVILLLEHLLGVNFSINFWYYRYYIKKKLKYLLNNIFFFNK